MWAVILYSFLNSVDVVDAEQYSTKSESILMSVLKIIEFVDFVQGTVMEASVCYSI